MEFRELNVENLVNIKFTDVIKIISSEETTPEDKMVYIYLLNVIMDMGEQIDELRGMVKYLIDLNDRDNYED